MLELLLEPGIDFRIELRLSPRRTARPAVDDPMIVKERSSSELLLNRLAASIVEESLPLKEVERELRGTVADIAVRQRGIPKKELASRCGVTEKSIENYLKETRNNPKSPDREIVRLLQDQALTLEEIYEAVLPILSHERNFSLDDTRRILDHLLRAGEVHEARGRRYRASSDPAIRCPVTPEAYRGLVDQKARDLDHIVLTQKQVSEDDLDSTGGQRFSRVVNNTSLVRIDFTVDIPEDELASFYEELSSKIARLTLKYEKKKGKSRVRMLLGFRQVVSLILITLLTLLPTTRSHTTEEGSWELDNSPGDPLPAMGPEESWELDFEGDPPVGEGPRTGLPEIYFIRGDVNSDQVIDVTDATDLLRHLYLADPVDCEDAGDVDDNGALELPDPVTILKFLFLDDFQTVHSMGQGPTFDATEDGLDCASGLEG